MIRGIEKKKQISHYTYWKLQGEKYMTKIELYQKDQKRLTQNNISFQFRINIINIMKGKEQTTSRLFCRVPGRFYLYGGSRKCKRSVGKLMTKCVVDIVKIWINIYKKIIIIISSNSSEHTSSTYSEEIKSPICVLIKKGDLP